MTDTTTPPPRSHRRRWIIAAVVTVVAAIVAAVMGVAAWIFVAADARSNVVVVPQSLTCGSTKTEFRISTDEDPWGQEVPASAFEVSAGPGTSCNLTAVVANTGSRPVHLRKIELRGMGRGSMLVAVREMSSYTSPRDHDDDNSPVFDIDETLDGGETSTWQFQLERNANASTCWDRNFTQWYSDLPTVTTSALGLAGETRGSVNLVVHGQGKAPQNCS